MSPAAAGPKWRAVWRWHFYAGLFAAPVLLVLATTGSLYLFEREIDHAWNRDLDTVIARGAALPLATQEVAVVSAHPEARIARVTLPHTATRASRWLIEEPTGQRELFVDPYSANVLGEIDPRRQPMKWVRDLHGTLLAGNFGSHLVELTACWTVLMLVTGLYLWWPASWRVAAFVPRATARGRAFWRDWHAIPAMFNALLVLLLVMTGLPWSAFWGMQFARLGEVVPFIAPSPNFTAHVPEHHAADDLAGVPWTIQHQSVTAGAPATAAASHLTGIADIEALLPTLRQAEHGPGVRVFYPEAGRDVFMVSYVPDRAQGQRTLYVETRDAQLRGDIGWTQYSPVARAVEWGVATHVGRQYGRVNQFANLAVCLTLIGSVLAGLVMWWKRRPPGGLGAPRAGEGGLPRPLVVTIATLAVLFPLLGVSLLAVLGWEWLARRGRRAA